MQDLVLDADGPVSGVVTGPPDGPVTLVVDGYGSRLVAHLLGPVAGRTGRRIVNLDRPGYWGTPDAPGGRAAWSARLPAVLDRMGVDDVQVLGASAGTPYAVRMAADHPQLVRRLVLVGPVAPAVEVGIDRTMLPSLRRSLVMSRRAPRLGAALLRAAAHQARARPSAAARALAGQRPPDDRLRMLGPLLPTLVEMTPELFGDGRVAAREQRELLSESWGDDARRVRVPTVAWAATGDSVHPPGGARWAADEIPDATCRVVEAPGFLALLDLGAELLTADA